MLRTMFGKFATSAVMTLAMLAWTSQAEAFWRWHGSSGGSSGGWGSSGGSSGNWGGSGGSSGGWGSSGGSSGGWGSSGGHRHHHGRRQGSSGSWGSSGGYNGSSGGGSSGGSSGGWGSSGGSGGGTYYYSPSDVIPGDPATTVPMMQPGAPGMAPTPAPAPAPGTSTSIRGADGVLAVSVPDDAKIYVNGQATTSGGANRQYISRDLQAGYNYAYEVRAEVIRDGKTIEQVKKIDLRAGGTANLAFDFPTTQAQETSLTVYVPADAKVFLAGNATKASGETRVFRTTGLSGSKSWNDYTVRVEIERAGRTVTKEETISLKAGESQELRFDFDGDKLASAR